LIRPSALEGMRHITIAACVALLALAGCGGGEQPAAAPAESEETARNTARTKLLQCLRDQGIEQPGQALNSRDEEKVQEALDGPCKEHVADAFGGTDPRKDPEFQDALTRFQACMRDEGIEWEPGQLDRTDPKIQSAMEQCRDELPDNLRGGG
jgi:hypothetical protein